MQAARRLYLLRHAQAVASASGGGSDYDRPLDRQGLSDAESLGRILVLRGIAPARVIASGSARTRQTWECIETSGVAAQAVAFDDALYSGPLEAYRQAATDETGADFLIIGHNPVIATFAADLAKNGERLAMEALARGFPTCGLAILRFDAGQGLEGGYLEELLVPPHRPR